MKTWPAYMLTDATGEPLKMLTERAPICWRPGTADSLKVYYDRVLGCWPGSGCDPETGCNITEVVVMVKET